MLSSSNILANALRFETALCSVNGIKIFVELWTHDTGIVSGISNSFEYRNIWVFKYIFQKMTSAYLFLLFCLCSLITVVQRMVIKQRKTVS